MYFDEDMLLDIRLHTLNKYIKKFIITEATYSHNGSKKELKFDIQKFSKFKDKINYIVVDNQPSNILKLENSDTDEKKSEKLILNGMARDNFQRNNLYKGLLDVNDEDLVLVSDLDEIPNLVNLKLNKIKNKIIIFEQDMFYYKFNLIYKDFKWFGTKAIKKRNLISPQWLRNIKNKLYPWWRIDTLFSKEKYTNISIVKNGGWHFTCIKTPQELERKLLNFAHHHEFEESGLKLQDLKNLINDKKIMYQHNLDKKDNRWGEGSYLEKIDISFLPEYIILNSENFKKWLD